MTYSLRFPTRDAADHAAKTLADEGYVVTWGIDAESEADSREEVGRARDRMEQLADDLRGEFLGNGSFGILPPD